MILSLNDNVHDSISLLLLCAVTVAVAEANGVPRDFVAVDADSEWDFLLSELAVPGQQLASVHILLLSHVLCRPILVHGPNELRQHDGSTGTPASSVCSVTLSTFT
jgi:hypothetical protein